MHNAMTMDINNNDNINNGSNSVVGEAEVEAKSAFEAPKVESDSIEALSLKLLGVTDELMKANSELQSKNEALYKSEKARKEMLANISHDLRAPLTAIRSSIDLINSMETISKEDIESTLGLIDRRVSTLESMVQDMYYLFCVEDEGRKLDLKDVDAGSFLEDYFFDATVDSRYDNHDMHLEVPMDLKCTIRIDVQKTIRVLDNLFTNAAKYSGDGSEIVLGAAIDGDKLMISVRDNGVGIDADALEHIFERTYTVSRSRTPGVESGSGLGLAIVKAVVEREGGSIKCVSFPGEGTSFIIKLPIVG